MHTAAIKPARKLMYRDYVKFPDDGNRHELIDGAHYVTPSAIPRHQRILVHLLFDVQLHIETHPQGEVFLSPCDVVFTLFDIVVPDLVFVKTERLSILSEMNIQGAPDLVVEILSPSTRRHDEGVKLGLYDRGGVSEYWVIAPITRTVRVYRRPSKALEVVAELTEDGPGKLTTPLMPGLAISLGRLFAK
jgi:Uma2 family endonuclease